MHLTLARRAQPSHNEVCEETYPQRLHVSRVRTISDLRTFDLNRMTTYRNKWLACEGAELKYERREENKVRDTTREIQKGKGREPCIVLLAARHKLRFVLVIYFYSA